MCISITSSVQPSGSNSDLLFSNTVYNVLVHYYAYCRQFEYHPHLENVILFGTLRGEAVIADASTNEVITEIKTGLSRDKRDSLLGLCWLKRHPSLFVAGSSHG
jgi:hypothetical protein